ncbi:MAG: class I SAM-dependent methyltransferase [Deltaproteobacteria bacterium]|jgi:predicted O-methyltransferase YrrM|nr:class I SAM-dependent methyltransferase [Deltaproteobacteria bacterium]MBW2157332.1 class I SAM-dependent methyltransferase [Deltaproteobacteria bacterium]MBW2555388.1 class I SAM-dependent methyltransferase [Deltaproteobacteria bacterium]MDX2498001.1 class I SAM-dependent methyltransferase [Desulfobacterales bacterium]
MKLDETLLNNVKGFLDRQEGNALYDIAIEASRRGPCLEIGSYCGKSTIYLGSACRKNNSILFSIDHHRGSEEQQPGEEYFDPELYDRKTRRVDTFKEFRNTIEKAGLEDTVVPMVCRSELAARLWSTSLSLVFIDGGHSYAAAYTDYNAWAGHIMPNGYLMIHDIFKNPEKGGQAPYHIYKLAVASGLFKEVSMINTLGVLKRMPSGAIPETLPKQ